MHITCQYIYILIWGLAKLVRTLEVVVKVLGSKLAFTWKCLRSLRTIFSLQKKLAYNLYYMSIIVWWCRGSSNNLRIVIGAMYAAVMFVGVNNSGTVQPLVAIERTVFYRERAAGIYSALPYALSQVGAPCVAIFHKGNFLQVNRWAHPLFHKQKLRWNNLSSK